jgi:choline kinase
MKVVMLLAGYGSRLQSSEPKCLVRFRNNRTLLDYQLEALTQLVRIDNIYMVVGFKKELIMEAAPLCTFVYNARFDQTNTAKSLLLAMDRLDDDILWLNGDVFFDYPIITSIASASENFILVNNARVFDEEVCYTEDTLGRIVRLAKGLGASADGEAVGINLIRRSDRASLVNLLKEVDNQDYFERAIELGIERKLLEFRPLNVGQQFVKEMDFTEDYDRINEFLSKGKKP